MSDMPETTEEQLPAGFKAPKRESTNIKAIAWFGPAGEDLLTIDLIGQTHAAETAETGKLGVLFKNGTRYDYQGVTRETVLILLEEESIGRAFNTYVKGREEFHCAKVDPETGEPVDTQE